jgi:hypothetical protein
MKKIFITLLSVAALALPALSLAASVTLTNGGLGQIAGNTQNFGVAVCNGGSATVSQSVPVAVTVGSQTGSILSASSIKAGACAYSYLAYSTFGMQAGNTYSVAVTIDPQHTVITNTNNQTTYSVTVPGNAVAQAPGANANGTADVSAQSGNWLSAFWNWLTHLL